MADEFWDKIGTDTLKAFPCPHSKDALPCIGVVTDDPDSQFVGLPWSQCDKCHKTFARCDCGKQPDGRCRSHERLPFGICPRLIRNQP